MRYETQINGIKSSVYFSDKNISELFLPLLRRLSRMKEEKGRRILVFLAAPPGAGKSTLLSFLRYLAEQNGDCAPLTVIGMDGFHRYQEYLLTHTTVCGGEVIPMVKMKGAPETFENPTAARNTGRGLPGIPG